MAAEELPPNEEVGQYIRDHLDANARCEQEVAAFKAAVAAMPRGPLSRLLYEVARAHEEFSAAEKLGGTTVGEEQRINRLLRSAMAAHAWLVRER